MKRQLFTLFFIAAALIGSAQTLDTSKQRQPILANPGYSYVSGEFLRGLVPPRDTIKLALKDSGSLAYKNGRFWQWSGTYWDTLRAAIGGAGGGGADGNNYPTSLSYSAGTLTLGRNGLANLTTTINVPAQFNPIAGTNVTLSGTYPNITFNATGGGGGSADSTSKPGYASKYYVDSVFNSGDTVVTNNEGATGVTLARSSNDTLHFAKLVAGANVTVTKNGDNSVTIASTASGGIDTATASLYYLKNGGNNFSSAWTVGSNTAQDLAFKVGGFEVARFNSASNQMLVGTTTPVGGYKFIVNGYSLFQGQEARFTAGAAVTGTLNTGSLNVLTFNTAGLPSHSSSQPIFRFTCGNPQASTGTQPATLVDLYKPIQRGTSIWDARETILRLRASIISGVADDIRGIWQDTGFNLLNTLGGSTYIGYDSTKKSNTYKFNVNGSVQVNKDSLPTVSSYGTGESMVLIDNTTGQLKKGNLTGSGTQTITSGTATTVSAGVGRVIVNPGSVLASHTLTLPASPTDRQVIDIYFGGTIAGGASVVTSLTISANTGQTLMQPTTPSTAIGGDWISYEYNSANSVWYRRK